MRTTLRWEPGRAAVLAVTGDLDHHGVAVWREALLRLRAHGPTAISVDLSGVTVFCCAALSELLLLHARCPAPLTIVTPASPVRRILGIVGLDTRLRPTG
ncbi:STAS domain-containing protein [Actinoplanes sp. NPDC051475]|uniref:STAS domain-containing protein n=1 Tax=Actinoplanes sp. NPDC051475 TaxID=3157225 RepID=UPI00344E7D3B